MKNLRFKQNRSAQPVDKCCKNKHLPHSSYLGNEKTLYHMTVLLCSQLLLKQPLRLLEIFWLCRLMLKLAYNNNMIEHIPLEKGYSIRLAYECFKNFYLDILNVIV